MKNMTESYTVSACGEEWSDLHRKTKTKQVAVKREVRFVSV